MNGLTDDVLEIISQYCPEVYCLLRLVSKEVKKVIDEVLPVCGNEGRVRFLQGNDGWKLLDGNQFSGWIDAMAIVYGRKIKYGHRVEKFCRDYGKDGIGLNGLHLLCVQCMNEYLQELFLKARDKHGISLGDWMKEVCISDDIELVKMVYAEFVCGKNEDDVWNVVKEGIQRGLSFRRWENVRFLLEKHPGLKSDKDLRRDGMQMLVLENIESFRKDRQIVMEAVRQSRFALEYADESFRKDKQIVMEAVKRKRNSLQYADESLRKDKQIVIEAVKLDGNALKFADESLRKDYQIVMEAVRLEGNALKHADESLRKDHQIVMAAVRRSGFALEYADESLRKDYQIVMAAVKQNGYALLYADESLKKDKPIVMEAVRQGGRLLQYADESLQKDVECLLEASPPLKKNKKFVLESVQKDPWILKHVDYSLQNDKEIVLAAVSTNGLTIRFASRELRRDPEVQSAALKQCPEVSSLLQDNS